MPYKNDIMQQRKIDRTLKERRGILRQLERLKQEDITCEEMEEIGVTLKMSGKRALRPLVRHLWLERRGDLISRYTYLLDFFEDEVWIDQLIQIALKRRDLDNDAKAAIFAALQGYGVDTSLPPFSTLFAGIATTVPFSVPEVLDRGEAGLVAFMEEFLFYPREIRLIVIRQLPEVPDPRVVTLLEVLLRIRDSEVAAAAITALGKIRDKYSVTVLRTYILSAPEPLAELAKKSLRRLSFLGIQTQNNFEPVHPLPYHTCCVSPPDGDGYRSLIFSRWADQDRIAVLCLQVHESRGIIGASGSMAVTDTELADELIELRSEEGVVQVETEYALRLMQDALYRNISSEMELPADFYVRCSLFTDSELAPAVYEPKFHIRKIPAVAGDNFFDDLIDDDFLSCWFMTDSSVYDFAVEWRELEQTSSGKKLAQGLESILDRFCRKVFPQEIDHIRKRLLLVADLMRQVGREPWLAEKTARLAESLAKHKLPYHFHPFLRRYALESMDMAREALAEGYDLRRHQTDLDDDQDD